MNFVSYFFACCNVVSWTLDVVEEEDESGAFGCSGYCWRGYYREEWVLVEDVMSIWLLCRY